MSNNGKFRKITNVLFIFILILILLTGFTVTVFFPDDINYYENRYSNKIVMPTVDSISDSSFQNSIEDALADQIPAAQRLKRYYNESISVFSDFFIKKIIKNNNADYINYKNGSIFFNGHYVYSPINLEESKKVLKSKAENYNNIFTSYPDIDFYAYYIEKDTDINFENGEKINADDYIFSLLNIDDSKKRSFEINSFEEFSKYFYKTDHHWNHTGSYKAYKDLVDFLECDDKPIINKKEILLSEKFAGSKAATAGSSILTEPFYAFEFDFPEFKTIKSSTGDDYGKQSQLNSLKLNEPISYGEYYGGDDGELIFDTGKKDRDNILIIGESYDNAVLKLLATHFGKTFSIDLRNYEHATGNKFNFKKYVKQNKINKVLLIGNIDFYCLDTFELEIN